MLSINYCTVNINVCPDSLYFFLKTSSSKQCNWSRLSLSSAARQQKTFQRRGRMTHSKRPKSKKIWITLGKMRRNSQIQPDELKKTKLLERLRSTELPGDFFFIYSKFISSDSGGGGLIFPHLGKLQDPPLGEFQQLQNKQNLQQLWACPSHLIRALSKDCNFVFLGTIK